MVSIGCESTHLGGVSLGECDMEHDSTELLRNHGLQSTLGSDAQFRTIKTPCVIVLQLILSVFLEVEVFLLPVLLKQENSFVLSYFTIILLSHILLWILFLITDRFSRYEHHISRKRGYLEFYRKTKELRRVPFAIVSTANTLLLALVVLWYDLCHRDEKGQCQLKYRDITLQAVISLEFVAMMISLIMYLVQTCRFNRSEALPDVVEQDFNNTALSSSQEIGFRDENMSEELMEKQAEMIRYLKEHNARLGKRLLEVTSANHS